MRIVVAGGSGLLGRALVSRLVDQRFDVVVLSRRPSGPPRPRYREAAWTPDGTSGPWAAEIDGADAVVNLSGAGMADRRWTPARKALLRSSRIDSTRSLVSAVQVATHRPSVFVQGAAVGYYGSTLSHQPHAESSPAGTDYLARLAVEWELAAHPVTTLGCRLVVVRTGVVLSRDGGALPPMARPFRFFVGGPIGSGRQYLSWITIDDWVSMVVWAVRNPSITGAVNATAPEPVTNREFAGAIGRVLHRPSLLPVPGFVLKTLFGEMADALLLGGQRVVPAVALEHGFQFEHGNLDRALAHVLRSQE
jgi:uncharacterized protein (TIGR01777 family)